MACSHKDGFSSESWAVRVVVGIGTVTHKPDKSGSHEESELEGMALNRAVANLWAATPGCVELSEEAQKILRRYTEFCFSELPPSEDNRKRWAVSLDGDAGVALPKSQSKSRFVGRKDEMAQLLELWSDVQDGVGHSVWIQGEAGIGKSRLVAELLRYIDSQSAERVQITGLRCLPEHQNHALFPVLQHLREELQLDSVSWKHSAEKAATQVERFVKEKGEDASIAVPLLCSWLMLPLPNGYQVLLHAPPKQRQMLFDLLARCLLGQKSRKGVVGPRIVVVEDLHWADVTTLEFLRILSKKVGDSSTLVLSTARPEGNVRDTAKPGNIISLQPLGAQAHQQLIQNSLSSPIESKALQALVGQTDGIPLFVEEQLKFLVERGTLVEQRGTFVLASELSDVGVSMTLRDFFTGRLDRLGSALECTQLASALGRVFQGKLFAKCMYSSSSAFQGSVEEALQLMVEAGVLLPAKTLEDEWVFRHALIRDAAYESIPLERYKSLHHQVAFTIEKFFPQQTKQEPGVLAEHFAKSESFAKAVHYGSLSVQAALERFANAEAIAQSEKALRWIEGLPEDKKTDAELRINSVLLQSLMHMNGWSHPIVRRALSRIERHLISEESAEKIPPAVLWSFFLFHTVAGNRRELHMLVARMKRHIAKEGGAELETRFLMGESTVHWFDGAYDEALDCATRALQCYDPQRSVRAAGIYGMDSRAMSLMVSGKVKWFIQDANAGVRDVQRGIEWARTIDEVFVVGDGLLTLAILAQLGGDRELTRSVCNELREFSLRYELAAFQAYSEILLEWSRLSCRQVDGTLSLLSSAGARLGLSYFKSLSAETLMVHKRFDEALSQLDSCIALADEMGERYYKPQLHRLRGACLLKQNCKNMDHAEQAFRRGANLAQKTGMLRTQILALGDLAVYKRIQPSEAQQLRSLARNHPLLLQDGPDPQLEGFIREFAG